MPTPPEGELHEMIMQAISETIVAARDYLLTSLRLVETELR